MKFGLENSNDPLSNAQENETSVLESCVFCWNSKLVDPNILREGFSDDVDGEDRKKVGKESC